LNKKLSKKMNKFSVLMALMLAVAPVLHAQDARKVTYANKAQIEDFFKSKTMVVMDADPFSGFNHEISDILKKYWTITPYEIIPSNRFDQMRSDPKLSFVFLSKVQLERDKKEVYYLYMDVAMGAKSRNLAAMPVLLTLPLAYTGVDEDDYLEKLPLMIRFAQVHINNLRTAKDPKTVHNMSNYSKESKLLLEKTLLVKETDLSEEVDTMEKIQKEYTGKVEIVESEEIVKAIEEQTPNFAVLHQLGPSEDENKGRSYRQIFGTDDAKLYYYNHQTITKRRPAGLVARDFRMILGKLF